MQPQVLLMHTGDDVALAAVDLAAGAQIEVASQTIVLRDNIPFGHKLALRAISAGEPVLKYGQPIGRATADIAPGQHVHSHNLTSQRGLVNGALPVRGAPAVHAAVDSSAFTLPPLAATFLGYRRPDGRAGVRNHVLVISCVQCAESVVNKLGHELPEVIAVTHPWGCSQMGADLAQTRRVLAEFATHPNVAATLLVGLGCETIETPVLARELRDAGYRVQDLIIQDAGGNRAALEQGLVLASAMLAEAARAERVEIPLSELILGVECGGSDSWSGATANPALGVASDLLVAAGGTVILSEVPEFIGAEHLIAARAASPDIAEQIFASCDRYEAEAKRMGQDLRGAQPTPGNIAGGLTTIEEKSLGAIVKGGSSRVNEFLAYAYRPTRRGLVVMETAGNDPESVTGMVAGGAQILAFTTGRGSGTGCPIAPVVKIASNSPMFHRLREDMDLDAGPVLAGEPVAEAGGRVFEAILAAASGAQTASEIWGAREFAINIIGPRV